MPDKDDRQHSDTFFLPDTRSIYYELNLVHPERPERVDFTIRAVYYYPDGSVMADFNKDSYTEADWTQSWHATGWGWEEPGNWKEGDHYVELFIGDDLVAWGWFTVYD